MHQIQHAETADGTHLFDGLGNLWIKRCGHGVVHFRYEGVVSGGFFELGRSEVLRAARGGKGRASLFVDAYGLKDYAPEFREQWVTWFRGNRTMIRRYVMLHRSVLVKLGMTVANVALGGLLEGHSSQETFEREFAATMASQAAQQPDA